MKIAFTSGKLSGTKQTPKCLKIMNGASGIKKGKPVK